jgi:hypothetical protein
MARVLEVFWGVRKPKYFRNEDWTAQINLRKHNKSPRTRNDIDGCRIRSPHREHCPTGKSPLSGEHMFLVSRTLAKRHQRAHARLRRAMAVRLRAGIQPGCKPINSDWSADVRFGAQNRPKSDIAPGPKSAKNGSPANVIS